MRNSSNSISFATLGLAFAIVLSPALMRGGDWYGGGPDLTCTPSGETRLSELTVVVDGLDQIDFEVSQHVYEDIWLRGSADMALVRAIPMDLEAQVTVRVYSDSGITQTMANVYGGGEVATPLEPGRNTVEVFVRPIGGASDYYHVHMAVGCSDCSDGNECTVDECDAVNDVCSAHTPLPIRTPCDFGDGLPGACVKPYGELICDSACTAVTCEEDFNDCTNDLCAPLSGACTPVADGTPCAGGTCIAGTCDVTETVLPCTGQSIKNASLAGGGPYTFDCTEPTTVVIEPDVWIDTDLILDGGGLLTVEGGFTVPNWFPPGPLRQVEFRSMTITGHIRSYAGIVSVADSRVLGEIINRNYSTMTIADSTLGGGVTNMATMKVTGSTFTGSPGDGIVSSDAGNIVGPATLELTNSTVSGNAGDGIEADGVLVLLHTTISGNGGGSIYGRGVTPLALTVGSSTIDGDCRGALAVTSEGYNIESPFDTCGLAHASDLRSVADPGLGLLADNGGQTATHALLPGSAAIDVIPLEDCVDANGAPLTSDQRGVERPQGAGCDVGAFELEVTP